MFRIAHKAGIKEITIIILIAAGWNLISLNMENADAGTDRNISLAEGWNLIGYSSNQTNLSLSSAKFINSSGSEFTWAQALSNNKLQAYLAYLDTNAQANLSKYKYLSTVSGMDDTAFRNNKGYWIYANDENGGNLSLPGVGGSLSGETYDWNKLRFRNASGTELNISDAHSATYDWIDDTKEIAYWDTDEDAFRYVCKGIGLLAGGSADCLTTTFNSWQGYFMYSNVDNLTLIRQN